MLRAFAYLYLHVAINQLGGYLRQLNIDDLGDFLLAKRIEHDRLIHPVEEFGVENALEFVHDLVLHRLVIRNLRSLAEAQRSGLSHVPGSGIAGHDDDGVLEIDMTAVRVGQDAVVEDLQQDIEYVGMRLFNFVKQYHRIRFFPDFFAELAAFLVPDISRRRPHQARNRELFHVFRHIDPHKRVLGIEEGFGKRFGELRFSHARGAEENKGGDGAPWAVQPGARSPDALRHGLQGLVLPDDPFSQLVLQFEQPL